MAETESEEKKLEPKNEKEEKVHGDEQMYSALSFAIMLLVIGIPLWWKTTEVFRVSLPYSEIDGLGQTKLVINLTIHIISIESVRGHHLVEELSKLSQISDLYNMQYRQRAFNKTLVGFSKSLEEIDDNLDQPKNVGNIQLMEIPGLVRYTPHPIVFGQKRTVYFASDVDSMKLFDFLRRFIFKEDILQNLEVHIKEPIKYPLDEDSRRRIPPSGEYDILFTVLNPEPERLNVTFNVRQAIEEYVSPLLDGLSELNAFHVKSQWLYFVNLQVNPKMVDHLDIGKHFALSQDLLTHVVTPLEKKLASHVSKNPCLNFVLWIPPCRMTPVHIYTSNGHRVRGADAFLSPQWGGIQIFNPDRDTCWFDDESIVIVDPDPKQIMSIFIHQLRLLLGVTQTNNEPPLLDNVKTVYLRTWEVDNLIRIRTVEQLLSAKLTLQSLSQLLAEISNIVINEDVGQSIYNSLDHLLQSMEDLRQGRLLEAYNNSKKAFLSSEAAFTHQSLLELLYFPDDQKYAVYIPLFLPVMIPVLISFKSLKEWFLYKLKSRKEKKKID